jgi:voltage-gated potassium channel
LRIEIDQLSRSVPEDESHLTQAEPPKLTGFDMFVLALSVFSLVNIAWLIVLWDKQVRDVVLIVDAVCSIAFLTDFFLRLYRAPTKSSYFIGERGWLDFIGSLPFPLFRLARILRMIRTYRPMRRIGGRGIWRRIGADRAGSALLTAVFLTIIVVQYASMAILWVEGDNEKANIHTGSDAVWWAYVTITTVGYGDRYPVTNAGRVVGVLLLSSGVGLFAVITGFLANAFLSRKQDLKSETQPDALSNRLSQLESRIEALQSSAANQVSPNEADADTSPQ